MGSVRDRITGEQYVERQRQEAEKARAEAAAKAERPAAPVVTGSRNGLTAGNAPTMSVRERAEMRAAQEPETFVPPRRAAAVTGTLINAAPMSVRERQERAKTLAELQAIPENSRTAEQQYWIDQHNELEAKYQREREQKEREQAEVNRKNAEVEAFNARMFPVRLMLDQYDATPSERKKIWDIAVAHPQFSVDRLYGTLLTLRRLVAAPKPDWF